MKENLKNKTIVVTGATAGIGLAVVEELLSKNTNVIGVGRSPEKCSACETRLRNQYPNSLVRYLVADLSLQKNIHILSEQITALLLEENLNHLDGLINNAGTFVFWFTQTAEGIEVQWAVNHLAPFLLTQRLLPLLKNAPEARVITVSSQNHSWTHMHWKDVQLHRSYNGLTAYSQSKLANVLFTLGLNQKLGANSSIRAYAVDPGLVNTDIAFKGTPLLVRWIWSIRKKSAVSPAQSAAGIVSIFEQPIQAFPDSIYWKDGKPRKPARQAANPIDAQHLWEISENMCGLETTKVNHV